MSSFIPGKMVKEFVTKTGRHAVLAYPKWQDLSQMLAYINALSQEDTFISFSGEEISLEDEAKFLANAFVEMELHKGVFILCFVEDQLAGICGVEGVPELRERGKHVGNFGISIAKAFRGEGIGFELAHATVHEAAQYIEHIRMIRLQCFANNDIAKNLYLKLGFVEAGRSPKVVWYKGEYIDEIEMFLELKKK